MKNYKYLGLFLLTIGFTSCDVNNELDAIPEKVVEQVTLNTDGLDFSKYISIGASFTAGYTDGAMFKAAQENSFPNILASKFGTEFKQPLMNDNIGGLVYNGTAVQPPRFFFNGKTPQRLGALPTTDVTAVLSGPFNNFGAPGAKSFHLGVPGYGQLNPYFGRMASSPTATVMGDALAQSPTFFTLSEIGGNDVLGYALSGGSGVDRSPNTPDNLNPANYGGNDITNPNVFASVFSGMVTALTANGAKGVVANVPYITDLANFTTVPFNALDPSNPALAPQIDALNAQLYGPLKNIFTAYGEPNRIDILSKTAANPVLIIDEDANDMSAQITGALTPVLGAPTATAFGAIFGKARQATDNDLLLLASSAVIATPVTGAPAPINVNGVSYPLQDQWVLTPQEQASIKTATDAFNTTIAAVASANPNVALVDFKGVLSEASTGIAFDGYTLTTSLVTGGLVSLDGVHLTARGYALMANKILASMDAEFGSNFTTATDGLAKAGDYPTNYSPLLR